MKIIIRGDWKVGKTTMVKVEVLENSFTLKLKSNHRDLGVVEGDWARGGLLHWECKKPCSCFSVSKIKTFFLKVTCSWWVNITLCCPEDWWLWGKREKDWVGHHSCGWVLPGWCIAQVFFLVHFSSNNRFSFGSLIVLTMTFLGRTMDEHGETLAACRPGEFKQKVWHGMWTTY